MVFRNGIDIKPLLLSDGFHTQKNSNFPSIIYVISLFCLIFLYVFEYLMAKLHVPFFDSFETKINRVEIRRKRQLGRPWRRWEDTIMMDLQEVGCGCVDWIELAQDRNRWRELVSAVMNLRVP